MVFRVFSARKTIPHRDCSETGAISKDVSNIAFLCMRYIGKNANFRTKFRIKKERTREILKN